MLLSTWMISMACQNMSTWQNHEDACNKFFDQTSKSLQVEQTDNKLENYVTSEARTDADTYLGPDTEKAGGGAYYAYKVYRNKAIDFKAPTMGIADKMTMHVGEDNCSVGLSWKFPYLK